jgi:hypothetical protein
MADIKIHGQAFYGEILLAENLSETFLKKPLSIMKPVSNISTFFIKNPSRKWFPVINMKRHINKAV